MKVQAQIHINVNTCAHPKVHVHTNMAYKHMFICKFSYATQTHLFITEQSYPIPLPEHFSAFPFLPTLEASLLSRNQCPSPTTLSLTPSTDLRSLCLSPGLSEGNSGERGHASRPAEAPLSDQTPFLFGSSDLVFFLSLLQAHALWTAQPSSGPWTLKASRSMLQGRNWAMSHMARGAK